MDGQYFFSRLSDPKILYHVMLLKTPFAFLIRFINNFTSRNYNDILQCYTFTKLTISTL
jgi:hypothetical protein